MQALGELKWLGIFICAYNIRSEVIVLFSISEDLNGTGGEEYPMDIWLLLASYIRPEDIVNFSLICKNAWTVTCTAAFWTRLYRRHYTLDASLPLRLRPESMEKLHCLRACVIRSLYHMYEPFAARISKNPAIPESTPSTLKNSKCLLFWCRKIVGNRQEPMWEFNFKFKKQVCIFIISLLFI